MKNIKPLIFLFTILVTISSCIKPNADFTTDKTEYTAGDTIHITDLSEHANKWNWTLPDGSLSHEKNVDFVIDINEIDCTKDIVLEATSKNGKRSSSVTKSIKIKQAILASDYFSYQPSQKVIPNMKSSSVNGANWEIHVTKKYDSDYSCHLFILLTGTARPTSSGIYAIQSDKNAIAINQAYVEIHEYHPDSWVRYIAMSGQLNIEIKNNGKVQGTFNNIGALATTDNGGTFSQFISGDITCY